MDPEILKLPRTQQGARIKAFEKRWLFHLGFTDEERVKADVLEIKLTFLPDGKIVMERGIVVLKPKEPEMIKKEVAACQ